jgi:hypothetical protein
MINRLRELNSRKEFEMADLRERLYCQHYRCLVFQKKMIAAQRGTPYYEKMKERFDRAKKRYVSMKKRLGGIKMAASNRMISEILGVPKGTVDSGLSWLKGRFNS